ncbi:pilus assembly protein TadG-related protein [Sphingopyxis indica]|uniref:Putative Flp pilus-assembly TadE/G-like n=1 Tax=Sphingopyxis indica TaxID=436663 RepID=A0A239K3Q9_9SPHN|nr:pilus assembly protein TadG-related protein [Sphingopyxis indica]SNT12765.1 Putative Flp pilus-assembly TadE/G-like [Sphingopyxis indica]
MRRVRSKRLLKDESGATAAVFGLSLFALVAIGGLGFDYARLAGMDSELQNAADQAALAGASQLDGQNGACLRASAAATTLVANLTLLANDGDGTAVTLPPEPDCDAAGQIRFWQDREKTTAATDDGNAHFIEVEIAARTANYAFTPLAGAMRGDLGAMALAGLGSAICRVPPVMFCNPLEAIDPDFNVGSYVGKGIRLIANDGGANYAPGNFGYLETNAGNGAQATAETLGRDAIPGDCVAADGVTTKPGVQLSVLDALNTRFDIYAGNTNNPCGTDGSLCTPSANTRKDVLHRGNQNNCSYSTGNGGNGWKEPANAYLAPSAAVPMTVAQAATTAPMGYPRDMCHAISITGSCADGRIGDGNWDYMAYFRTNSASYPTEPTSADRIAWFGTDTPTRYDVYKYEMANSATRLVNQSSNGLTARSTPYCSSSSGVVPGTTTPDRRVLTVAVVNCQAEGVGGRTADVHVTKWIDMFLVEPSLSRTRTEASDVYGEIIGETELGGGGGTSGNTVRRDVPYLIE